LIKKQIASAGKTINKLSLFVMKVTIWWKHMHPKYMTYEISLVSRAIIASVQMEMRNSCLYINFLEKAYIFIVDQCVYACFICDYIWNLWYRAHF